MTPKFQRLFSGYHCVFVGDPKKCTPYACFATRVQAENLNKVIIGVCPIMTVEEWEKQYSQPPAGGIAGPG